MAKDKKEMLITWLNDAHAMELSLLENLKEQSKDAEERGKSEVMERINEHIEETRRHAEMVEECIHSLGGEVSKAKDTMSKLTGAVQGKMKSLYHDTMVKNALESYAAENFEIASYTSIFAAAEEIEAPDIAEMCEKILDDEVRMSEWALEQISTATKEHMISMSENEEL